MIQRVERGEPIQKWVPTYRLYELCARERGTLTLLHLFRPHSFGLPAPVYMNWHPFSSLPPSSFSLNVQKGTSKKSNRPKSFKHDEKRRLVNYLLANTLTAFVIHNMWNITRLVTSRSVQHVVEATHQPFIQDCLSASSRTSERAGEWTSA